MHEKQLIEKMKEIKAQDGAEAAYFYFLGVMDGTPAAPTPPTKMADLIPPSPIIARQKQNPGKTIHAVKAPRKHITWADRKKKIMELFLQQSQPLIPSEVRALYNHTYKEGISAPYTYKILAELKAENQIKEIAPSSGKVGATYARMDGKTLSYQTVTGIVDG